MSEEKSITNKPLAEMTFESALLELEAVVKMIDSGHGSLEESIKNFERGVVLKNFCEEQLKKARLRIEKIMQDADGKVDMEEVKFNNI